jgi:hypothetical protein
MKRTINTIIKDEKFRGVLVCPMGNTPERLKAFMLVEFCKDMFPFAFVERIPEIAF